jgi:hypothetical protein
MIAKSKEAHTEARKVAAANSDAVFAVMEKRAAENFFAARGFSAQTIHALVANGMHLPEEVLLLTDDEARHIPGLESAGQAEVHAYRTRFSSNRA